MIASQNIICPKCHSALSRSAGQESVLCPKCNVTFRIKVKAKATPVSEIQATSAAEEAKPHSSQRATNVLASAPTFKSQAQLKSTVSESIPSVLGQKLHTGVASGSSPSLGLMGYLSQYFYRTRWPSLLWIVVAALIGFVASALKPFLGNYSILVGSIALISMSLIAGGLFIIVRTIAYLFQKQRVLPERPRSRLAALTSASFFAAIGLFIVNTSERFAPDEGIAASTIPAIRDLQIGVSNFLGVEQVSSEIVSADVNSPDPIPVAKLQDDSAIVSRSKPSFEDSPISTASIHPTSDSQKPAIQDPQVRPNDIQSGKQFQSLVAELNNASERTHVPEPGGAYSSTLMPLIPQTSSSAAKTNNEHTTSVNANTSDSSARGIDSDSIATSAVTGVSGLSDLVRQNDLPQPGGSFSVPIEGNTVPRSSLVSPKPGGAF